MLIADDHAPTREALRLDLEAGGIEVCAEAETGAQAVEAALRTRPDVCLIDVRMPVGDGTAATRTIRRALPSAKVVLITAAPDEAGAAAAARAGAHGYLDKSIDPRSLPQLVRAVTGQAACQYPRLARGMLRVFPQACPERSGRVRVKVAVDAYDLL